MLWFLSSIICKKKKKMWFWILKSHVLLWLVRDTPSNNKFLGELRDYSLLNSDPSPSISRDRLSVISSRIEKISWLERNCCVSQGPTLQCIWGENMHTKVRNLLHSAGLAPIDTFICKGKTVRSTCFPESWLIISRGFPRGKNCVFFFLHSLALWCSENIIVRLQMRVD